MLQKGRKFKKVVKHQIKALFRLFRAMQCCLVSEDPLGMIYVMVFTSNFLNLANHIATVTSMTGVQKENSGI